MLWEYLRSEEFKDAVELCKGVCAIPIGCVEAHGVHLPLACDTLIGREIAVRAAEKEPVCIFPSMYFGEKSGAGEFPGTIIFPATLIMQILEQSCKEIARNGFKKIVIVNAHGGNSSMLNTFTRNLLQQKLDFLVYNYHMGLATPTDILENPEEYYYLTEDDKHILQSYVDANKRDGHGGFSETGCLYDICPEYVRLDKMDAVKGTSTGMFDEFGKHDIYTPFGWMGNYPNSLNADMHYGLNERIARALAAKNVEKTIKAFKFLREENISTEYHKEWMKKQR